MTKLKLTRLVLPTACMFGLAMAPALAQSVGGTDTSRAPNSTLSTPVTGPAAKASGTSGGMTTGAASDASKAPMSSTSAMGAGTASTGAMKPMSSHGSSRLPSGETFKTAAAATAHCPGDTVVWSTLSKSKSYHLASSKYFGKTKHGAYVCEKDATAAGFHPAKT